jgi:hypothetical protein
MELNWSEPESNGGTPITGYKVYFTLTLTLFFLISPFFCVTNNISAF